VIEQLGNFQAACRDAARRVGLIPYAANAAEPFDAQRHQLVDVEAKAPPGAIVAETVASGYTFQGRLIRPALVRLRNGRGNDDGETKMQAEERSPNLLDRSADVVPN
jgi:molecular chaperone GrpE (heat shock protein)